MRRRQVAGLSRQADTLRPKSWQPDSTTGPCLLLSNLTCPSTLCCVRGLLPLQSDIYWGVPAITQETFADCANLCTYDEACQMLQFDYLAQERNCRLKVQPSNGLNRCV